MESITKHLEILFYIIAFFSGISCMTFVVFFSKKDDRKIYHTTIEFLSAAFIYLGVNFLQFYKEFFYMSDKMNILLMLLLDLGMTSLAYFWIRLGRKIAYPENNHHKPVFVLTLSMIYVLGWLLIYLFFTDADYYIYKSSGKLLGVAFDSAFFCGTLVYIFYHLYRYLKSGIAFMNKLYLSVISVILGIYMGWFYLNDVVLIHFTYGAELWDIYPYDPVILFYILINAATMVFFYKRNYSAVLAEKTDEDQPYEAVHPLLMSEVARKFDLTKREAEITALVYRGLSNPEISKDLFISTYTVKRHMQNIFKKMNIKHRSELIHLVKSQ